MSTIHPFTVQCVICSKPSEQYRITSYSSFGGSDLDFRPPPRYRGTMSYWIDECPYCGYINVSLEHPIDLPHEEIKKAREEIETGFEWKSEYVKVIVRRMNWRRSMIAGIWLILPKIITTFFSVTLRRYILIRCVPKANKMEQLDLSLTMLSRRLKNGVEYSFRTHALQRSRC